MPMWRCPHCGTPQAETARCWVCRRSSTTCSTCRHYRRAMVARVGGWCGLDRKRLPLRGDEMRGCWDGGAGRTEAPAAPDARSLTRTSTLAFVPVVGTDETAAPVPGPASDAPSFPAMRAGDPPAEGWTDRRTLFGDAET